MSCKIRSTIVRRYEAIRDFDDGYSDDSSEASSYFSYTDSSFPQTDNPIGPLFQFTLASSLKGQRALSQIMLLRPTDNVIRFDSGFFSQGLARTLELINGLILIRNRKHIQHLSISFTDCFGATFWRSMITGLTKTFPSVRFLYLNFEKSFFDSRFNDKDLIWLSSHIRTYMSNLKHLSLKLFDEYDASLQTFKVFFRQIAKGLKRLESFTLDFNRHQSHSDSLLKPLTHLASSYLRHLKHLKIISAEMSDQGMREMHFNKTRYLKQLESFELLINRRIIPQCLLSAEELLLDRRKSNPNMRQLSLYFAPFDNRKDQKGLAYLASTCLQYLQNLKALSIDFGDLRVELEAGQTFIKAVNTRMGTLEQIKVHFRNSPRITEAFLESFECPENNNLKRLEMHLIGEEESESEPEVEQEDSLLQPLSTFLSKPMPNLKSLISLDLFFERVKIGDQQVKTLISCLTQNLSKLESINIKFFLCPAITEASVEAFQEGFCCEEALPSLRNLLLTFSSCSSRVTQEHIDRLRTSLEKKKKHILECAIVHFVDNNTDSVDERSSESYEEDYKCFECDDFDGPCREHRRESDDSDVNLTDFVEEDDQEEIDIV